MTPLSSPYTHEYFQADRGDGRDLVYAVAINMPLPCEKHVPGPVLVVASPWLRHVWHLLYDVIQPAFHTWQRSADLAVMGPPRYRLFLRRIEREADMSPVERQFGVLRDLEDEIVSAEARDSPIRLLRLISRGPVEDKRRLDAAGAMTCFDDLQVGLDPTGTPFSFALRQPAGRASIEHWAAQSPGLTGGFHPANVSTSPSGLGPAGHLARTQLESVSTMVVEHSKFVDFVRRSLGLRRASAGHCDRASNVAGMHRIRGVPRTSGPRRVTNLAEALDTVAASLGAAVNVATLAPEGLNFSQQLREFQATDVLIAVHGQALANIPFLAPNAAVVLILEPGRFGVRWMFANLALASGVHVVAMASGMGEGRSGALDGWGGLKDHVAFNGNTEAFKVDVSMLLDAVRIAVRMREIGLEQRPWPLPPASTRGQSSSDHRRDDAKDRGYTPRMVCVPRYHSMGAAMRSG